MEGLAIVAMTFIFGVIYPFALYRGIRKHYRKHYIQNKHKISDAEIIKLMDKANHFLSEEQLAAVSPLTLKEAKKHLMHLSFEGVIKRFQNGGNLSIYCLAEALPEEKVFPISIQGLSDQQIIDQILKYSDDYQVTLAELVVVFGLDVDEAKIVLKRLKKNGLVSTLWKGMTRIHVIKNSLNQVTPKLKIPQTFENKTPLNAPNQEKLKIPDADVIRLAIDHKGRLTPTLLCLKLKIPMHEAKMKLEELYDQGAFEMHVGEGNAVLEYQLRDRNLL